MRSGSKFVVAALAVVPLAACGMVDGRDDGRPALGAGAPADAAYDALPEAPLDPGGPPAPRPALAASDAHRLIGDPYSIDGQVHTPADVTRYDEIGYAAVLWTTADGRRTANGEAYAPTAIAAAHRTLPIPSYVEVTSIDTGKTILVRINDRGPMLNDRIIALTPGAAQQLGIAADGTAGVRVRLVNPLEQERATLRSGGSVPERLDIPPALRAAMASRLPARPTPLTGPVRTATATALAPAAPLPPPADTAATVPDAPDEAVPQVRIAAVQHTNDIPPSAITPAPPPAPPAAAVTPSPAVAPPATRAPAAVPPRTGGYVVQVAALSSRGRADALARAVDGYVMPVGSLFRVRTGPYPGEAAARTALRQIHAKGYADARMMINDAR